MPESFKILGQANPAAATDVDLYTVPAATQTMCSSIVVCNRNNSIAKFRVWFTKAPGLFGNESYAYFDVPIAGNDTFVVTAGFALATGDKIGVRSDLGGVTFQAFGDEVT